VGEGRADESHFKRSRPAVAKKVTKKGGMLLGDKDSRGEGTDYRGRDVLEARNVQNLLGTSVHNKGMTTVRPI